MARFSPAGGGGANDATNAQQDEEAAAIEAEIFRNQLLKTSQSNDNFPATNSTNDLNNHHNHCQDQDGASSPASAPANMMNGSPFPTKLALDVSQLEQFSQNTLEEFLNSVDQSQRWTFLAKEEDVSIYTYRPVGQTRECIKGEGIIKSDPSILLDEIWDPEVKYRKQWDEMLSEAFIVEQLTDTMQISYTAFRSPTRLVASRDFVVLRKLVPHDREGGDLSKGFAMVFKSIEFDHPICIPKKRPDSR